MLPLSTRILVPLDGSLRATAAIPVAAQLAALDPEAEVILLRVIPPPGHSQADDLPPPVDLAERHASAELRAQAAAYDGRRTTCVVLVGHDPAAEIVRWLRRQSPPVQLVVMVPRASHGLRRLLMTGTTAAVQRSGLAPVVTVPSASVARHRSGAAA